MARYEGGEQGLYPGTGVLINKLNIADQAELDAAEAAIVLLATFELSQRPLPEPPSGPGFQYFLSIHRALFQDVYAWAGQIRDLDIAKGQTRFANFRYIASEGNRLTEALAEESWLAGLNTGQFASRMAYYMGELNVLHPFREGNGRALREYVRYLAGRAGHPLSWHGVTSDEMIAASISAYQSDHRPLEVIILRQIAASSQA
ncbi:cell filamentation protein Fic [Cereibacter changlensis JA139]|uniref:protein adenylyltransferase n=2 Tax=Cereibacter changlensis TaxID=402884 RepID=A0A2T4JP15_9RHOB|nr:Fic family protein [Cereibacter changlensis]PTE19652.1 cell filamentation protein Fic [Cereibacter changlensis JA139]PZX47741.1 cell filamentation protein [Cereibacter changlensis]